MSDEVTVEGERDEVAFLAWEGDCRDVLRRFPKNIRAEFGFDIWLLQLGERPRDSRPMSSIGKGVFELRQRDEQGWYRVVYLSKVGSTLYMLHSFVKKSAKTSRKDLSIAQQRLKVVKERLQEERKHAKEK